MPERLGEYAFCNTTYLSCDEKRSSSVALFDSCRFGWSQDPGRASERGKVIDQIIDMAALPLLLREGTARMFCGVQAPKVPVHMGVT